MKNIVVLGATGSIGTQTLDVARSCPTRLKPIGLSAHSKWRELFDQARTVRPAWITLTNPSLRGEVDRSSLLPGTELLWGEEGVERMVTAPETHTVVAAMVGAAGLRGTVRALCAGKAIALANKETLVVGGPIVTGLAKSTGARLLPVDSEHSAIFQCLQSGRREEVSRIILTASGGPFRKTPLERFENITVEEALQHPTWRMGPKITIDSATMMNKALEIIEAHWLFDLSADQIAVVVHPQSMVHSFVEYVDGSVVGQISPPDMRLPIQYALTYPDRLKSPARKLGLAEMGTWEFELPDHQRFPALELGYEVVRRRGTSGAALNAANEIAVARFLRGEIRFSDIVRLCEEILAQHPFDPHPTLECLEEVDRWARQEAGVWTRSVYSRS
ncbi:MAG: 1-deoxy-D-xylulose-5-phosphate reductoisomerase [Planctomycetota bacterium]